MLPRFLNFSAACMVAAYLFSVATKSAATPPPPTFDFADFAQHSTISHWNFDNGGEYPGARGSVRAVVWQERPCAELSYDFTPEGTTRPFDPHYVMASCVLPQPQENADELRFLLNTSGNLFKVFVRVSDSSGQTHQYRAKARFPLTSSAVSEWANVGIKLEAPESSWGGKNDGIVHFPIKAIGIVVDAAGRRDRGSVRFTGLEFGMADTAPIEIDLKDGKLVPPSSNIGSLGDMAGVNIHFTRDDRAMDLIKSAGFKWVRMDALWDSIERADRYDFLDFDALVDAAERRKLQVIAILAYGHARHTGGAMLPPRTPEAIEAYANFCEAAAKHYRGRPVVFEIWNEPDVAGFWGGSPSSVEYGKILKAGIAAVKRGNPQAIVLPGGLSAPYDVTYAFWEDLAGQNALKGATGWSAHLYTDGDPEERWTDILWLKERIAAQMPGAQVWCTEWGTSSAKTQRAKPANGHERTARDIQAFRVVRSLLVGWAAGLRLNVVYDIRDDGDDPANPEHNFGLLAADYSEKPAMMAVRTLLQVSEGKNADGFLSFGKTAEKFHVLQLRDGAAKTFIAWSEDDCRTVAIALPQGYTARDLYGHEFTRVNAEGRCRLQISSNSGPVYLLPSAVR
jgi:hypothetical protein